MTKKSKKSKKLKKLKKAGNILYYKDTKRGTTIVGTKNELSTRPESNSNKKKNFFEKFLDI